MVDFNGFDTSKIFEEIKGLAFVFNASGIVFSNAQAEEMFPSKQWDEVFFEADLQRYLDDYFQNGRFSQPRSFPLSYTHKGEEKEITWQFKDISLRVDDRVCMALGEFHAPSGNNKSSDQADSFKELILEMNPAGIDAIRVLAANIPNTNVFLIDKNLNYLMAEGPSFAHWGLEKSYFEGKNVAEIHITDIEKIIHMIHRTLQEKQVVSNELSYKQRVYDITAIPIFRKGEVEYVLGISRDVSNEHSTRKELQKNELKYRRLVEESTEIIFSINKEREVTFITPNIKQFLGYEPHEFISGGFVKLLHPEDQQAFIEQGGRDEGFFEHTPYVEFRLRHKSGDYRIFSANGKVIYDETGGFRYYTGIARDVSQVKEAKKELYLSKERAEQALNARSQFLSVMSHEIRTPMNAVIGMCHLLIEGNPREDQLENLHTLQFSAENLLELINNILDFSKIDSGRLELERVPFNIRHVLQRIIHSCTYQVREKNLSVVVDIDPYLPKQVMGDPVRLAQIFNNLMSNAIKFTDHGTVRVGLEVVDRNNKELTVRFVFEDTGIGIPEEKLDVIFDVFAQANINTTRKYGGTGLGLAIVKKLIGLFNSEISVQCKPEGGTLFQFDIAFGRVKKKDRVGKEKAIDLTKDLGNYKVLVAEDNLVNQVMLKKFLQKWEVGELMFANNGAEAIDQFLETDFDLLLLDLQMPVKDGFEVAKFIRGHSDERKSKVPIIALTASAFEEVKEQLEEAKFNDFIAKPFNPDDLLSKLIKHIQ